MPDKALVNKVGKDKSIGKQRDNRQGNIRQREKRKTRDKGVCIMWKQLMDEIIEIVEEDENVVKGNNRQGSSG